MGSSQRGSNWQSCHTFLRGVLLESHWSLSGVSQISPRVSRTSRSHRSHPRRTVVAPSHRVLAVYSPFPRPAHQPHPPRRSGHSPTPATSGNSIHLHHTPSHTWWSVSLPHTFHWSSIMVFPQLSSYLGAGSSQESVTASQSMGLDSITLGQLKAMVGSAPKPKAGLTSSGTPLNPSHSS